LPEARSQGGATAKPSGFVSAPLDPLAWLRERWVLVAGLAFLLLLVWWLSARAPRSENGRYVLVKDDVPCQSAADPDARRWCYLVLDTRTGKLEERVRKLRAGGHGS
jgi:hypothetical protein